MNAGCKVGLILNTEDEILGLEERSSAPGAPRTAQEV